MVSDPSDLELQVAMNFSAWILETKPTFFGQVLRAIKPPSISSSLFSGVHLNVFCLFFFLRHLYLLVCFVDEAPCQ